MRSWDYVKRMKIILSHYFSPFWTSGEPEASICCVIKAEA
jgi:hypothetical protein